MAKDYKIQKKKTTTTVILNILFKVLVGSALIIFAYIIYDKADFSSNKMHFSTKKSNKQSNTNTPSQLKWFDDFKGVENIPKKQKDSGNTGFKYEGFKK